MNKEIWKDIEGYEGLYQISNKGRVRREGRTLWSGFKKRRKILSANMNRGYLTVSLCKDGIAKKFYVHRLVAKAFVPNPENKPAINHINGKKEDPRAQNLEWVSFAENSQHAFATGLASNSRCRKFSFEEAEQIRQEYSKGIGIYKLGKKYGTSYTNIKKIVDKRTYKEQ